MCIDNICKICTIINVNVHLEDDMDLTRKQYQLFEYLQKKISGEGKTPSLREIAADLGVSHNAVAQLMRQLESKGVLVREGRYSRSIRLRAPQQEELPSRVGGGRELPVIGEITAGLPMYAQQVWDGTVVVDATLFQGENLFCLRIKGDSMCNAGILDGDLVICEPRQYAENGEIVAVLLHGEEATVKRFFLHAGHVELQPENEAYSPMRYSFGEVLVQGKVIGVIRTDSTYFDGSGPSP